MKTTKLAQLSRQELERTVIRMRMELHRQEIRQASRQLLQPAADLKKLGRALTHSDSAANPSGKRQWLRVALLCSALLEHLSKS